MVKGTCNMIHRLSVEDKLLDNWTWGQTQYDKCSQTGIT